MIVADRFPISDVISLAVVAGILLVSAIASLLFGPRPEPPPTDG
jgi:hypothetical protein